VNDLPTILERLSTRFDLATTTVNIGGQALELLRPRSADDLLDEELLENEDRAPYWAELWTASHVLAQRLARERGMGLRCLELGCGIGMCAAAAIQAGFTVLATDYFTEALDFAQVNVDRNGLGSLDVRLVDWTHYPADLAGFDRVVASDVLYERQNVPLVAHALACSLAPDGLGLIADPGRRPANLFIEACRKQGLRAESQLIPFRESANDLLIEMFEVRWAK
jgi:predicted nicotinamide N-methyase